MYYSQLKEQEKSPERTNNETDLIDVVDLKFKKEVIKMLKKLRKIIKRKTFHQAIPLLGIYTDKTFIQKNTCTLMFIAALFTIAKTWKQPNCPSTDEWIKKMWYISTMEYYSAIKKNKIMPFEVTWMEPETLIQSEVSQRKTDTI